jgi:hypothetical protein
LKENFLTDKLTGKKKKKVNGVSVIFSSKMRGRTKGDEIKLVDIDELVCTVRRTLQQETPFCKIYNE